MSFHNKCFRKEVRKKVIFCRTLAKLELCFRRIQFTQICLCNRNGCVVCMKRRQRMSEIVVWTRGSKAGKAIKMCFILFFLCKEPLEKKIDNKKNKKMKK